MPLQAEKFECSPMEMIRLKQSNSVHEAKKLEIKFAPEMTIITTLLSSKDILDPLTKFDDLSGINLKLNIPQLKRGEQESIRKSLTLAMITEDYARDKWTPIYTDGSATRTITAGGAGILITHPSGRRLTHHMATRKHSSKFRTETEALIKQF